jgi:surface antigen
MTRRRLTVAAFALTLGLAGFSAPAQAESWQCVTFARFITGMKIFGDAWTWWDKATGQYAKGFVPESGAVLVFKRHGGMSAGHVAVVSQVLTDRIIQVTHANWSPIAGRRGQVEEDVTMVDVSDQGDWSKVKVWYDPAGDMGRTVYPTYGFIYQAAQGAVASLSRSVSGND